MKKRLLLCAVTVFLLFAVSTAAGAADTEYVVDSASCTLFSSPDMNGEMTDMVYRGTVLTVEQEQNGYGYVTRRAAGSSGWVDMDVLRPLRANTAPSETVTGISVIPPEKRTYVIGEEEPDDSGLLVYALYADGTRKQVFGYSVIMPPFSSLGEKTVYITYCPPGTADVFSASFTVSVVRVPVGSVSLEGAVPADYPERAFLQTDGMLVRVTYLDGRPDTVLTAADALRDSRFTVSCSQGELQHAPLALGTHTVRFAFLYADTYADYTFTVRERRLVSLSVSRLPDSTAVFTDTMIPSVSGLLLKAMYDNGETETVDGAQAEILFDSEHAVYGDNTVRVRFGTEETTYTVTVRDPEKTGLTVLQTGQTVYALGDKPDLTQLRIGLVYESGTVTPYSQWEITGFDTDTLGERRYLVSGDGFSTEVTYYVTQFGFIPGDCNTDGVLTASDARLILRHSVQLETLSGTALLAADRNGDGGIHADDARLTLRASVRLEPIVPGSR